jgi:histidinol-phosphate aminotransferase
VTDSPSLTRADLTALPSYVPGRNPADLARDLGMTEAIKLASNEVPYGPLPGVTEALAQAAATVHRYPDMGVVALRETLAERYGLDVAQVATGCGSVAVTEHLVKAAAVPGDEVVYSWRSFEAYPIITAGAGVTGVKVPNTAAHGHDLDAMAAAVTDKTRLVLLCSPNNPTGTVLRRAELERFLDAVPDTVLVVLDEAYREFVTDQDVPDGLDLVRSHRNVVVLRTLSKAWGLAGLRVGWLAGPEPVAEAVRKVVTPFSTNALAQVAALAALKEADEMRRRVDAVIDERKRVLEAVRARWPEVPETEANFVWLPIGDDAKPFAAACESQGVIVRAFPGDGVRVTIGTPMENDAFLAAAAAALG